MANNKYKNLIGQKFNLLTVISENGVDKFGRKTWLCKCDCGNESIVPSTSLVKGDVKSCGCLRGKNLITHNHSNERLHSIWKGIRRRCNNPHEKSYKDYGGRGIKLCDEWNNYENFREWALSHGYRDDLTIDRIDVNKNYCPTNCRWLTKQEQARNKQNTLWVKYNGELKSLPEWAEYLGINYHTLFRRIYNLKWDIKKAFETPSNIGNNKFLTINGETKNLSEWAKKYNISKKVLNNRLKKGIIIPDKVYSLKEE